MARFRYSGFCLFFSGAAWMAGCAPHSAPTHPFALSLASEARLESQIGQGTLDAARRSCEAALADAPGSRMEKKALELIELAERRIDSSGKPGERTAVFEWAEPLLTRVEGRVSQRRTPEVCGVVESVARLREMAGKFPEAERLYSFAADSCGSTLAPTAVVRVASHAGRCEQAAQWAVDHWTAFEEEGRTQVMGHLLGCMQAPLLRIRMPLLSDAEFKRFVEQYRSAHEHEESDCRTRCDAERAECDARAVENPACKAEYAVCTAGCGT